MEPSQAAQTELTTLARDRRDRHLDVHAASLPVASNPLRRISSHGSHDLQQRTGETAIMPQMLATERNAPEPRLVVHAAAPRDWEKQTPLYRATQDLRPATRDRYRSELPFSETGNSWQYGSKPVEGRSGIHRRMAALVDAADQFCCEAGARVFHDAPAIAPRAGAINWRSYSPRRRHGQRDAELSST